MKGKIKNSFGIGILMYLISFMSLLIIFTGLCFVSFLVFIPLGIIMLIIGIYIVLKVPFRIALKFMSIKNVDKKKFIGKNKTIKQIKSKVLNKYPFKIEETKDYDLVLKFKLADSKWSGVLFKGGLKKNYELFFNFKEDEKTVYVVERTKTINWDTNFNPPKANLGFSFFSGIILFDIQKIKMYDTLDMFNNVANIYYNISEVKWPIFNMLLDNGWTIKPKIFVSELKK